MTPDLINGMFESIGALMIFQNVRTLHRDKMVRGVHWGPTGFFASWGLWNLFYYPHLEQWFSFVAGAVLVTINTIWLIQMLYYRNR